MEIIYIIGTAHKYQKGIDCEVKDLEAFKDYLREVCKGTGAKAIAEEMSLEALSEKSLTESTCKAIANELLLQHQYSDPDTAIRKRLSILQKNDLRSLQFVRDWPEEELQRRIREQHEKREQYWLNQIKALSVYPLLFICGACHVNSFSMLLRKQGFSSQTLEEDWSPTT